MSQTFRTPPRQIGFKPAAAAAPRLTQVQAAGGTEAKIRQQLMQLQQLQSKLKLQEERMAQLKVPSARQMLEAQIQQMRKEMGALQQTLMHLRGELRVNLLKALPAPEGDPAEALRRQLAEFEAIYRVHQPIPQRLLPAFEGVLSALRAILGKRLKGLSAGAAEAEAFESALTSFARDLWQPEAQQLRGWWARWRPQLLAGAEPEAATISFGVPTKRDPGRAQDSEPRPPQASAEADDGFTPLKFDNQGPLELSFDLGSRKSVVRNQMGITLNQPKKNYQEYLEDGFAAIDETVASRFENRQPLYGAVESFLEAISLDRSRYEAYFGLGYLYSLVKDVNHAIYFLDLAWRISGDPAIEEMMARVRSACAVGV